MSEELGESLSALMDGEASDQDLQRVLDRLEDKSVRDTWARYHSAGRSLATGAGGDRHDIDLSQRISAAIAQEPELDMPAQPAGEEAPVIRRVARWQSFSRPMASFAVAASGIRLLTTG